MVSPRQDRTAILGVGRASKNGNSRVAGLEQYYTPEPQAQDLLRRMLEVLPQDYHPHWIEPAGGTGAFIKALLNAGVPEACVTAYDLHPKYSLVQKADFLSPTTHLPLQRPLACITNPPFGRNSSLSVPFFNKLAENGCEYIGFVIPKSWRKWTLQGRLSPEAHLLLDEELSVDYVDEEGNPAVEAKGGLATIFQVWQVDPNRPKREKVQVEDRGYLRKVAHPKDADVALVVFGYSCGTLLEDFPREKAVTTTIYLQVAGPEVTEALRTLPYKRFSENVAFVQALSLKEVQFLLNERVDQEGLLLPTFTSQSSPSIPTAPDGMLPLF